MVPVPDDEALRAMSYADLNALKVVVDADIGAMRLREKEARRRGRESAAGTLRRDITAAGVVSQRLQAVLGETGRRERRDSASRYSARRDSLFAAAAYQMLPREKFLNILARVTLAETRLPPPDSVRVLSHDDAIALFAGVGVEFEDAKS